MDARLARAAVLFLAAYCLPPTAYCAAAGYRTRNFIVNAPTPELATRIGKQAEQYRHDLAVLWLGKPLADWPQPCPITAQVGERIGAGGATSFMFDAGTVYGWQMQIQGSQERVLDSVLPHEVTHTVFATYFRRPLPRWADEGACTTVEHASERNKQQQMLISFLRTGRGIPFQSMFAMKEYPHDVLPLYAQGHSLASFLIQQGGRQKFLNFVAAGLQGEQWPQATKQSYGYASLGELQNSWLDWVKKGSPAIQSPTADPKPSTLLAQGPRRERPQPNLIYRGQSADEPTNLAGNLVPVTPKPRREQLGAEGALAMAADSSSPPAAWQPPTARERQVLPGPESDDPPSAHGAVASSPTGDAAPQSASTDPSRQVLLEWDRANPPATAAPPAQAQDRRAAEGSVYAVRNGQPAAAE
ncbi:MAG: hypothetical protein HYX69_19685 [Planctomycetia bacterium]|nr:hypothetical protein [Planctomycetia bacterium]